MSEQEYTIRAARPTEASAILDLWQGARSTHATTPDRAEYICRLLAETPGSLLVADAGCALLGTLIAAWDGWRGNMYRLVVLREHRRRGIGLALVRAGEEHLRREGAHRITALVAHEDEVASAFWESAGYPRDHPIGRRVRSLSRGKAAQPNYCVLPDAAHAIRRASLAASLIRFVERHPPTREPCAAVRMGRVGSTVLKTVETPRFPTQMAEASGFQGRAEDG